MDNPAHNDLKELVKVEMRWNVKCVVIYNYHIQMSQTRNGIRGNKWKIEDTARELNLSTGFVSESLKLAKALMRNENIKFFTRESALKYLKED